MLLQNISHASAIVAALFVPGSKCGLTRYFKSPLENLDAGDGIEVKKSGKPNARERHRKAFGQSLLRGRLYETAIIFISALQQDFDGSTVVLFGLRVVSFGVSLRHLRNDPLFVHFKNRLSLSRRRRPQRVPTTRRYLCRVFVLDKRGAPRDK